MRMPFQVISLAMVHETCEQTRATRRRTLHSWKESPTETFPGRSYLDELMSTRAKTPLPNSLRMCGFNVSTIARLLLHFNVESSYIAWLLLLQMARGQSQLTFTHSTSPGLIVFDCMPTAWCIRIFSTTFSGLSSEDPAAAAMMFRTNGWIGSWISVHARNRGCNRA